MNTKNRLEEFIAKPELSLWKLSIPMILGMMVNAMYILIDTAFIGNWVGSKAIAVEISQSAVELKVLIEQIREQIQNIE